MMAYRGNELKLLGFLTSELDTGEKWLQVSRYLALVLFKTISELVRLQKEKSLPEIKAWRPASRHLFYWLSYSGQDKKYPMYYFEIKRFSFILLYRFIL
jgi:hypothetical protein